MSIEHLSHELKFNAPWSALEEWLERQAYSKVFLLADENTWRDCYSLLPSSMQRRITATRIIPPGESSKNLKHCRDIWSFLLQKGVDRKSVLLNLGGGMITDIGGFCAATILRGIDFIHIPTSLLCMVDASIGGKTGIDFKGGKNLIGQYVHPAFVFVRTDFLNTLPRRQLQAGQAEMAKHALLESEDRWKAFLEALHKEDLKFGEWIPSSISFKAEITARDFRETQDRQILNLGHTLAHAIESMDSTENDWLHGEAVWAGLWCAVSLSESRYGGRLDELLDEIKELCQRYIPGRGIQVEKLGRVQWDKKWQNDQLNLVLLSEIGQAVWPVQGTVEEIKQAAVHYNNEVAR